MQRRVAWGKMKPVIADLLSGIGDVVDLAAELKTYLEHMKNMGFAGLALRRDLFVASSVPVPRPVQKTEKRERVTRVAPVEGAGAGPAREPSSQPTAKSQMANPAEISNLFSIMDMVETDAPSEDNSQRARRVTGANQVEMLRNLYTTFASCQACALGTTRNKFVFGEGPPHAELMFVGEGPGQEEDRTGRPFVGKAGQLLDRIIQAMGFKRGDVFITNVVKCRPPKNRKPLPDEMATCSPILQRQVETIDPAMIVVLGGTALRFFKGGDASIMRLRGKFFQWKNYTVMPTFHPAYVLRNPRAKRDVWEDMQRVMAHLKSEAPT